MGFRHSEYEIKENQTYVTPQWVWDILYRQFPWFKGAYDCCPANATFDFLKDDLIRCYIATNPPYGKEAEKIVRHALHVTKLAGSVTGGGGSVAMLLPHAWDTAKTRKDLFTTAPFYAKLTLTRRIRWENLDQKAAGPSSNHAWYVWDWDWPENDGRMLYA